MRPSLQVGADTPRPPTPGGRVTLGKLLVGSGGRTWRPRPRDKNQEEEKSCQAPGPASRLTGPPPPRRRPKQVPPLPQPGAHSAARPTTRPASSRPFRRVASLHFPLTVRGGSATAPPPTPPVATVHTHSLRSRTHSSLTYTHSATTAPQRPTYYASLARYVHRARGRARLLGARTVSKGQEENACTIRGKSKSPGDAWEMKFRV